MTSGTVTKVVSDPARWAEVHAAGESVVHELPVAGHHHAPGLDGAAEAGEPEFVAGGQP